MNHTMFKNLLTSTYFELVCHDVFDATNGVLDFLGFVRNKKSHRHVCHFRRARSAKVVNDV